MTECRNETRERIRHLCMAGGLFYLGMAFVVLDTTALVLEKGIGWYKHARGF